jgi:hypothetical protein
MPLSLPDRALILKLFYVNSSNAAAALREFRHVKGMRKGKGPMTPSSLRRMVNKFEETGSFTIKCGRGRKPVPIPIQEEIATAIVESSGTPEAGPSARGVARQLDIPYATVRKVLRKIIQFYPYKISRHQQLIPGDSQKRVDFALMFLARMDVDDAFPWKILWGDEAHFYMNGTVNTQNCRIWASEPPNVIHEIPLHSPNLTVWCGFTARFILGPYFFEELRPSGPVTCSVTAKRYLHMLETFVVPQLQQRQCLTETVFMQDGAPPHIGRAVQQLLRNHFTDDRVISRYFHMAWPPRSPDLTPCDFWLWGYLKSNVYRGGVANLNDLKDRITQHVRNITPDALHSAVEHVAHRLDCVLQLNGGHVEHELDRHRHEQT